MSGLTWRRLKVLIAGLPPESMLKTAIRDGMSVEQWEASQAGDATGWGPWSLERQMLALIVDGLARVEWTIAVVNSAKGKAPKMPQPMSRPGVGGPMAAVAQQQRADSLLTVARLKAMQRAMGATPTDEQVQAVMREMQDEMTGGGVDE